MIPRKRKERRARERAQRVEALWVAWERAALKNNVDPNDVEAIRASLLEFVLANHVSKRDVTAMLTRTGRTT